MRTIFGMHLLAMTAVAALSGMESAHASVERVEQLMKMAFEAQADVNRGSATYQEHCASCHGRKAQGDSKKTIPTLAGQRRVYLIKQLADFVELERNATQMHAVAAQAEIAEPQTIANLAAYLSGLPPLAKPQTGNGKMLALGEADYGQWCESCHEADGRGDEQGLAPSLRSQHYSYLQKEIRAMAGGHRFDVDPALILFLDSLDADEVTALADYISRMSGPVRDRARLLDDGSLSN